MPTSYTYNGQGWVDGNGRPVTGAIANELNDRALAQKYQVDYDRISKTSDYQSNFKKFGTGFRVGTDYGNGFGGGITEGLGDYVAGGAQAIEHGLKALGLQEGNGAYYYDALNKVREGELANSPTSAKVGRFVGDVAVPLPAGKVKAATTVGRLLEGAKVGAIGAAAMPTVVNPGEDYLSNKAGQVTTGAIFGAPVGAIAGKLADRGIKARAPSDADIRLSAGKRQNIPLAYSQVTDSGPTRMYADIMSQLPGGGALRRQARSTVDAFDNRVQDVTQQTGRTLERSELGDHIEKTFGKKGFIGRFETNADNNYNAVTREVHPTTQVDLTGTRKAMMDTLEAFPSNPALGAELGNSRLRKFADALTDDQGNVKPLFFNEAQRLRSEIGKMMGSPELMNDIPRRELAQVYGALSDDMAKSLAQQPNALRAFNHASRYYKAGMNRIQNVIEPLLSGNKTESTVDRLTNVVKDNAKAARTLRRSATPEEWDTVAASIFHDLGKEGPGAQGATGAGFSIPKFLTDFNKLRQNDRAYQFAFGGTRYAKLRDAYGDLAEIADSIKHSVKMANPSRSGYTAGAIGLASALFANPALAFKAVASNYALSRALAAPKFARWMVKAGRFVRQAQQGSGKVAEMGLRAHIAKLPGIAASDSDIAEGIGHIYQYFIGGGVPQEQNRGS